jgi:hypothetical protein
MTDKYEATLQDWLAKCDGDWECLARALFHDHHSVVVAREKEKKELVTLFGFGKPHRIRGKDLTEIMTMLARLATYTREGNSRKTTIGRLQLTKKEKEEWEKVLSEFNAQQKRRRALKPASCLVFDCDTDTE